METGGWGSRDRLVWREDHWSPDTRHSSEGVRSPTAVKVGPSDAPLRMLPYLQTGAGGTHHLKDKNRHRPACSSVPPACSPWIPLPSPLSPPPISHPSCRRRCGCRRLAAAVAAIAAAASAAVASVVAGYCCCCCSRCHCRHRRRCFPRCRLRSRCRCTSIGPHRGSMPTPHTELTDIKRRCRQHHWPTGRHKRDSRR